MIVFIYLKQWALGNRFAGNLVVQIHLDSNQAAGRIAETQAGRSRFVDDRSHHRTDGNAAA